MASVVDVVKSSDFYAAKRARLFDAMVAVFSRGELCDPLVVLRECERTGMLDEVGGREALAELGRVPAGLGMARHYAEIVREKALARRLIGAAQETLRAAHANEGRGDELLDRATEALHAIAVDARPGRARSVRDLMAETIAEIDGAQDERCVVTGLHALDAVLGPMVPGSMNVLGARPSMGKTALALNVSTTVANASGQVLFFSAEMPRREIVKRVIANEAAIELKRLRGGTFLSIEEYQRRDEAAARLKPLPLVIDDRSAPTVEDIRAGIIKRQQRGPVRLVVVDYIGLVRAPDDRRIRNRENEVGAISRGLKAVAKDCEVPMLVLSQLSRESARGARDEKDPGPPTLTDLRDSGSIEQDADVVMFLHRPYYYTKAGSDVRRAVVVIRKNRNGEIGDAALDWCGPIQRFSDAQTGGA
jgi:replicative DNA helicase